MFEPKKSMNLQHKISFLVGAVIFSFSAVSLHAQDLIARQAPVDHKVKAADSVSLKKLLNQERAEELRNLYPDFNNTSVHKYSKDMIPDSFKIDLRHFCMPTPSRKITSNYGYRRAFRRVHKGIDVKVYIGDTIRSAFSGKVRIVDFEAGGYGKYVVIRHNNGLETVYGHLSKQLVSENQIVRAGEPIGLGGNTGLSTGSHLHFETLFLGVAINPAYLFDFENQDIVSDYFTFRKDGNYNNSSIHYAQAKNDDENGEQSQSGNILKNIKYHKVERGETLSSIANSLGTTVDKLCSINHISKRHRLRAGQILRYEE